MFSFGVGARAVHRTIVAELLCWPEWPAGGSVRVQSSLSLQGQVRYRLVSGLACGGYGGAHASQTLIFGPCPSECRFGLGVATVLTLVLTPSLLAIRVWAGTYVGWIAQLLARMSMGRASAAARDWALQRDAKRSGTDELIWSEEMLERRPASATAPAE